MYNTKVMPCGQKILYTLKYLILQSWDCILGTMKAMFKRVQSVKKRCNLCALKFTK